MNKEDLIYMYIDNGKIDLEKIADEFSGYLWTTIVNSGISQIDDIKDIIRELSVDDCFAGPEKDRAPQYEGWIFKFSPLFEGTKLYIKIRVESIEKSVCLSIHEFGKYDEVS